MRITRATTYLVGNPWKNWLFVRLDTDQPGLFGVGGGTLNASVSPVVATLNGEDCLTGPPTFGPRGSSPLCKIDHMFYHSV